MLRLLPRRALVRAIRPAHPVRLFTTSRVCFETKPPSSNDTKDDRNDELQVELERLRELEKKLVDGSLMDRIRMTREIASQLAHIEYLQAQKIGNIHKAQMEVGDPFDMENLKRQQTVYSFMLKEFTIACKAQENLTGDMAPNQSTVPFEVVKNWREIHTEMRPVTMDQVVEYFTLYWKVANNYVTMDQIEFGNEFVQQLLKTYNEVAPYDDKIVAEVAQKVNQTPEVISGWFHVFDTIASTPFSPPGKPYANPVFPSGNEAVKESMDRVLGKMFKQKQDPKKNPFVTVDWGKEDKSKNANKDKKKEGDVLFQVEFTPKQLFQIGLLIGLTIFIVGSMLTSGEDPNELSFQTFVSQYLSQQMVKRVTVVNGRVAHVELTEHGQRVHGNRQFWFNIGSLEQFEKALKDAQDELGVDEKLRVPVIYSTEGQLSKMLINFIPTLLFLGAIWYMTKNAGAGGMGGPFNMGKSKAKKFNSETNVKVKFADVAGMAEAKEEVMEFVKFLQNPEKYEKLGAKIPRGAILSGPPGTGKTLLAKATAGEAGVPFYSVSGSEFVEMFVGVGASRVRDLFKTARENAPSIVFIDEIDAIGKQRSKGNASGANDERETTLNQLLVEMDGFDSSDHVVVFSGTNRPDILDKALMRPGRFDRHVYIDNPELKGRKEIFEVHLKKIHMSADIDPDISGRLAALTPGFSGADIANVCNEAALIAARHNAETVGLRHFELAIERVIGGVEKKSKVLSPEEKKVVAYHEAGHAVCGWYLEHAHPLLKVSIIPRGQGALGYAQYLPPDQYLYSSDQLIDRMVMTLGGRVSEELHFDFVTSGAHDDFKKVTNIAQSMVLRFGMSPKVGMVNYADTQSQDNLTKPFSDETNTVIDDEIQRIVKGCYTQCLNLLKEKSDAVEKVAQELLKKEFITREDMIRLLGKRPFPETNDAFDKYLDGRDAFMREESDDLQKKDAQENKQEEKKEEKDDEKKENENKEN